MKAIVVGRGHLAVGQAPLNRGQLIWQREILSLFLQESVREAGADDQMEWLLHFARTVASSSVIYSPMDWITSKSFSCLLSIPRIVVSPW